MTWCSKVERAQTPSRRQTKGGELRHSADVGVQATKERRLKWTTRLLPLVALALLVSQSPIQLHAQDAVGPKVTLAESSRLGPALSVFGLRLYLAWASTDVAQHLNLISSGVSPSRALDFTNKVSLGETSRATPALAEFKGRLYIAWAGTDGEGHLNLMSSADGVSFPNKVVLDETSFVSPALVVFQDRLYLAWTGTNGFLNIMSSSDGISFTNKVTLGETSPYGPAMARSGEPKLALAWTGTDPERRLNVVYSLDGVSFINKATLADSSLAGPSLEAASAGFGLAWTGSDTRIRALLPISTGAKFTYDETSSNAPALYRANGIYLAWTGMDQRLNVQCVFCP